MKKSTLLALLMVACILTGCGKTPEVSEEITEETTQTEATTEETTASPTPTPRPTRVPTPLQTATPTASPTPTPIPFEIISFAEGIDLFPDYSDEDLYGDDEFLEIATFYRRFDYDWQTTRKQGSVPGFVMSYPTLEAYPELKVTLDELSDGFYSVGDEYLAASADNKAYNQGFSMRRADSKIVSFVSSVRIDGGVISNVMCINIDPGTGEILFADDIFTDPGEIASLLDTDTIEGLEFVIEPSGVTFVSINDEGDMEYRTILYNGNESLFSDGSLFDLDSYVLELGNTDEYIIDIDNDGTPDNISIVNDVTEDNTYQRELSIIVNGNEIHLDDIWSDGEGGLTLICDNGELYASYVLYHDNAWYETHLFRITSSSAEHLGYVDGVITGSPVFVPNHDQSLYNPYEYIMAHCCPSDPSHLYFREVTNLLTTSMTYYPISLQDFPEHASGLGICDAYQCMSTICDVEAVDHETGEDTVIPEGTRFRVSLADNDTGAVVIQDIDTGDTYDLMIDDTDEWPRTVNGINEYDLFEGSCYAG